MVIYEIYGFDQDGNSELKWWCEQESIAKERIDYMHNSANRTGSYAIRTAAFNEWRHTQDNLIIYANPFKRENPNG
jgi:hypothetical protein